jgi:hypothetical protein
MSIGPAVGQVVVDSLQQVGWRAPHRGSIRQQLTELAVRGSQLAQTESHLCKGVKDGGVRGGGDARQQLPQQLGGALAHRLRRLQQLQRRVRRARPAGGHLPEKPHTVKEDTWLTVTAGNDRLGPVPSMLWLFHTKPWRNASSLM